MKLQYLLILAFAFCVFIPSTHSFTLGSCLSYSLDGTKCQQCITNYHLYDGKCYADILGCKLYNFGNICAECQTDYILVNNYCCDRTCISQMYQQQDPKTSVTQVVQQSQVLQQLLVYVNTNYFAPLQLQSKLSGISFQKYQDVVRFFLLYELFTGATTYKRLIYDYDNKTITYTLVDDTNLSTAIDFQVISFDKVTSIQQAQSIFIQFPTIYQKPDPSLAIIKILKLNKVKQYEIMMHNQNTLKSFYIYNSKIIMLYDITLTPQYFKIFMFGPYADQALNQLKFLSQCKSIIEKNSGYVNSTIKSFQIFNSSSVTDPMKVMIYSQNLNSIIKSVLEVYYSAIDVISNVTLISTSTQMKNTTTSIVWSLYFQNQYPNINKVIGLIFSGYNSTLDIPSAYKQDSNIHTNIQWQIKLQQWKIFTKYHLHITTDDSTIQTTVVHFDFTNEYRIDTFVKVTNVTQSILKSVNTLVSNFTINNDIFIPYERTIEGWYSIQQRMTEKDSIKNIVLLFVQRPQYKIMNTTVNITKLSQKSNRTHTNYTFGCQNSTFYLKATFTNITQNGTIVLASAQYAKKQKTNYFDQQYQSNFGGINETSGVQTQYRYNKMKRIFTDFSTNNKYAMNLNIYLRDIYKKYRLDPKIIKNNTNDINFDTLVYPQINGNYTNYIMQLHPCLTSNLVEYLMSMGGPNPGPYFNNPPVCLNLYFVDVIQNGIKKTMYLGNMKLVGTQCNATYVSQRVNSISQQLYAYRYSYELTPYVPKATDYIQHHYSECVGICPPVQQNHYYNKLSSYFDNYASRTLKPDIYSEFKTYKNQQDYEINFYLLNTPYIRWGQIRTDTKNNVSFQIISYIPSNFYQNKTLPNYSGNFNTDYHHICPGIKLSAFIQSHAFRNNSGPQYFMNPVVTDWYANYVGKDSAYNVSFLQNISKPEDISNINSSLQLLKTAMNTTTNFSLYRVQQTLRIGFDFATLYLQRLNSASTQDYMSLMNISTNKMQIISWMPFFKQQLEFFNFTKSQQYLLVQNNSYLNKTIGLDYQPYLSPKIQDINTKIYQLFTQPILKLLSLSNFTNPTFQISLKKVFYANQNLTNQSSIVNYIVQVSNLSYYSPIYGQNTTLQKTYYSSTVLIRYFTTKNITSNITTGDFVVYLLQMNKIVANSSIGNFILPTTVQNKIQVQQTMANFTVGYNFNLYSQNSSLVTNTSTTNNNSYFNVVTFGLNVSQGGQKFKSITSDQGKVLEDGQIVQIKYLPDNSLINSSLPNFADYSKNYNDALTKILPLIQTKFKQRLVMQNLTITILLIQKLTDPTGFHSYHMLIKVNVTYNSLSSLKQQSVNHVLRFTYLTYKQFFTSMGNQFLPANSYAQALNDIKAEPNLYFEPLSKISNLNYVQSFLIQSLTLINGYIKNLGSLQKAVIVNSVYFRNFVDGGFYKVYIGFKSGNIGIGYMLQINYDYTILEVQIIEVPVVVNNNTNLNSTNNTNPSINSTTNTTTNSTSNTTTSTNSTNNINSNSTNSSVISNSTNTTTINTTNSATNNTVNNTTANNTTPTNNNPSSSNSSTTITLESIVFANVIKDSYYDYLQQIIYKLRLQYSAQVNSSLFKYFNFIQSTDGQFYNITFQYPSLSGGVYSDNFAIYRCNTTCSSLNGTSGSLYVIGFDKNQILLNGTKVSTHTFALPLSNSLQSTISESYFHTTGLLINGSSSIYNLSQSDAQSLISIFELIYNQQNITSLDTKLLEYQKYLDFLKQYMGLIIDSNTSKLIDKSIMTDEVKKVIDFVRQKYLSFLNNSVVITIVQNSKIYNDTKFSLYILVQSVDLNSTLTVVNGSKDWTIYKVVVNSKQVLALNYEFKIVNFTQFAKNGHLSDNLTSIVSSSGQNKQQIDIAFGYELVNISSIGLDIDIQFTLGQVKAKYSYLLINKVLKQVQRMQLKNGTTNYKLLFQDPISSDKVKIIVVYKKNLKIIQILNKLYLPNQSYKALNDTQLTNNNFVNNTISLINQLHSQQLSSPFITVTNIQVNTQPVSPVSSQNQKYRIQFSSNLGKSYSSIVEYNQTSNSFIEISFNQIFQIPKDSSYRLNTFQQQHAQGFIKIPLNDGIKDSFYQIAINKLKTQNITHTKILIVFKKYQSTTIYFKLIYQIQDNTTIQNNSTYPTFETIISVDPMNQIVQFKENPLKLNFTDGFTPVLQTQITQQNLIDITNSFTSSLNFTKQQMLIKQSLKKYFLDGFLLKITIFVKLADNTTKSYELLAFRSLYSLIFNIWAITPILSHFQQPCSSSKACVKCSDISSYKLSNGICLLQTYFCIEYFVDLTTDILKCTKCLDGYQIFDDKCINRQAYPQLFV